MNVAEDKSGLLSTPLHGVFIPVGLVILGVGIMIPTYLPHGIALALALAAFKFWRGGAQTVLDPTTFREFELESVTPITHDTQLYRFLLPKENDTLGLKIGQSIQVGNNQHYRNYTPISLDTSSGGFELVVKTYPQGVLSRYFATLKPLQTISARGPIGEFEYKPNMYEKLGMVAAGTGITPMLQIIDTVIKNPKDRTKILLVFCNKTQEDILLKEDLDELASKYPNFKVHYIVETESGRISKDQIRTLIPSDYNLVCCGVPEMNKLVVEHAKALDRGVEFVFE